ncbi:MAG: hypothetical protein ABI837_13630 [Acidobacteriota bacterium]
MAEAAESAMNSELAAIIETIRKLPTDEDRRAFFEELRSVFCLNCGEAGRSTWSCQCEDRRIDE